ncbi:28S ribosomal protein S5, mitochondrial [Coemansia javaensis]|uniref:Small ribosomal subunit protein uS5m n=1 Tax=Coemansia javaensis TaxID=2761396 RepID=A0A9W8HE04_9FUNG|nr:28S ribosomal protein S5, mitochondrial [Coemansia javaensis]
MAAVATKFAGLLARGAGGSRLFSATAQAARGNSSNGNISGFYSNYVSLDKAQEKLDLWKLDPIYDSVDANRSVIELWKRQKAKELGADAAAMNHAEGAVIKEHGIVERQSTSKKRPEYPRQPPPKGTLMASVENELFWSEDLRIPFEVFRGLSKKTLVVKRTVQMTRKGKMQSMYALVVVGDGRGSAGFGEGKSQETAKAVLIATRQAIKSMQHFPRYDSRTIYHDIEHKFKATKLLLWARRPGFGCRVSPIIHEICECIGIQDLAGKIHGSRNPMNVIKAVFEALQTQRVPTDLARARGLRLVDVNHKYYGGITPAPVTPGRGAAFGSAAARRASAAA